MSIPNEVTRRRPVAAAAGLALLVVGVPVALALMFGWPFPRGLPRWSEISAGLKDPSYIPDRFWIGLVAVLAWLGWAYVAAAVAVEVVARVLHRPAPNVALFASPVRDLARRLVGSAALVTALAGRPAFAAPPPSPAPVEAVVAAPAPYAMSSASLAPHALAAASSVQVATSAPVYEVHPWEATRDCLWTIAERHLGDPLRWREIWELNRGQPQPDGGALEEPDLILPGWQLQLPADAVDVPAGVRTDATAGVTGPSGTTAAPAPAPAPPTTAAPTTLAPRSTAAPTTAAATSTAAPTTAAPTTAAPTSTAPPATASPVSAGSSVAGIPAPGASGPSPAPATTTSTRRPAPAPVIGLPAASAPAEASVPSTSVDPPPTTTTAPERRASAEGRSQGLANGARLLGAGLLSAGVIATIDRLRRAQRRRRRPGERVPLPEPELAGVEWAARLGADLTGAAFIELALRALVGALRSRQAEPPAVLAAQLGRRQLELVLAEAAPAPPPFLSREGGRRWVLPRSANRDALEDLAEGAPSPLPGLVTLGTDDTGAEVLVDLEGIGLVSLVGDAPCTREVVLAAGVQLATNEWRDFVSVVLVGFPQAPHGLERVQLVTSVEEVLDDLERLAEENAELLADAELGSTLEARVAGEAGDAWIPTLVLCAAAPDAEAAERLVAVATGPGNAGVGVLIAGEVDGAVWELPVEADTLQIPELGLTLRPQRLPEEEAAAVEELIEVGRGPLHRGGEHWRDDDDGDVDGTENDADEDDVAWSGSELGETHELLARWGTDDGLVVDDLDEEPEAPQGPANVGVLSAVDEDPAPNVLVRLLGPLEIDDDGELVPLERGKAREALSYLASHPRAAVDGDRLCEALWPGQDPRKKVGTFNTTMWFVRNALGLTTDGSARLPKLRGTQRLYRLDDKLVDVDYDVLVGALRRARGATPEVALPLLRDALELVRGRPLEHVGKGYEWAFAEGLVYEMEATVADAAHRLAELCLDAGDAEGAHWAVRQGLRASPGNEQLYRDQMRAANAAGNPAGVEAAWEELGRMAEEEEPYDGLDPATVATYRELSRRAS